MSCDKLLQRIVAPDLDIAAIEKAQNNTAEFASHLHDYTHGINSDPVTRLAIIFSALIHDSDHRGVSNAQLGKEDQDMANRYQNKSLAGKFLPVFCVNHCAYHQLTFSIYYYIPQSKTPSMYVGTSSCRPTMPSFDTVSFPKRPTFCGFDRFASTLFLVNLHVPHRQWQRPG